MPSSSTHLTPLLQRPLFRLLTLAALAFLTAAPVLLDALEAQAQQRSRGSSGRSGASRGSSSRGSSARSSRSSRSNASRSRSSRSRSNASRSRSANRSRARTTRSRSRARTTRTVRRSRTTYGRSYYGRSYYRRGPGIYYAPGYYGYYGAYGYYGYGGPVATTTVVHTTAAEEAPRTVTALDRPRGPRPFFDFGAGVAADTQDGSGAPALQLGLGMREGAFGMGLSALAVYADPQDPSHEGAEGALELGGVSADGRIYLPLGPLEPYGMVGFGYYGFSSADGLFRPTLDVGAGVDLKLGEAVSVGARYTYNAYLLGAPARDPEASGPDAFWSGLGTVTLRF